ncbi:MAG: hypothetical protein ABI670_11950 [Chloroflexota bacterium]
MENPRSDLNRSADRPPDCPSYEVLVADNFHYRDGSRPYRLGAFSTCDAATAACRQLVDEFLRSQYKPGTTSDDLWRIYIHFGEEPYIVSPSDADCAFSSWDYARARCEELCSNRLT